MATKRLEADSILVEIGGRTILKNIYLNIPFGTCVGLFGRNGSGKSTLLEVVYGIRSASNSSVRVNGHFAKALYLSDGMISLLPQAPFLPESISIAKLSQLYSANYKLICDFFPEFDDLKHKNVATLSQGSKRLLEVSLILAGPSEYILLDEPFAGVAPLKVDILKQFIETRKKEKGILLTDQSYRDVLQICESFYLMLSNGSLISVVGDPVEQLANYGYLPTGFSVK